ncbi:amino acid permease 3-like [Senna tora]|uniref:Amino acid permease 3-like n=1 Tax=Senna tora TaxID=362788 RepID=A0A834X0R7_9FABA|nr:amino acid permease 3-like [Senna tora]
MIGNAVEGASYLRLLLASLPLLVIVQRERDNNDFDCDGERDGSNSRWQMMVTPRLDETWGLTPTAAPFLAVTDGSNSKNDGSIRVFKKFEKGEIEVGDHFCLSGKAPGWFYLKGGEVQEGKTMVLVSKDEVAETASSHNGFDIKDIDVSRIDPVKASTELGALQEDANVVHKFLYFHSPIFYSFLREFGKESSLNCSAKVFYDDLTLFDYIGKMYVDAKTISNLVFDPGGTTNVFLLAIGKLSHLLEIFTTLNMPSLCLWKCCYVELEEYIGNFIVYSEDASKVVWFELAAIMSFTYSTIGVGLGLSKAIEDRSIAGSLTGISVGTVTVADKVWRSFQAIGNIAFAYSYSMILIEIQINGKETDISGVDSVPHLLIVEGASYLRLLLASLPLLVIVQVLRSSCWVPIRTPRLQAVTSLEILG